MQNILSFAVAVSLTVWTAVAPRGAAAAPAQATAASDISPVVSIHGTIVGVNERARLVTVRDDGGQVLTVSWTEFTRLAGDPIKVGPGGEALLAARPGDVAVDEAAAHDEHDAR